MSDYVIGMVGNPNCGKTTLFNALTGTKQRVGNWPGVTVDRKSGEYFHSGKKVEVIDLPGIYSLSAASLDEEVARDYIFSGHADVIVNIIDATNIQRNLYLTVQLLEMKVPMIVALNMMDMCEEQGIDIDIQRLSQQLDCPVVALVASKGKGLNSLKDEINRCAELKMVSSLQVNYPSEIQKAINDLKPLFESETLQKKINPRYAALKSLEGDERITSLMNKDAVKKLDELQTSIAAKFDEDTDILLANSRYELIRWLTDGSVTTGKRKGKTLSDGIDSIVLNRILGIPLFFAAMYLMFMMTINIGGAFIDFFDILAGTVFVEGVGQLLGAVGCSQWLITILAGGIGGGIQTIATFIPPIGFMFLCLCFLEDSGYMARAAFVMDRFMRTIGLPGKAFVPMLIGFGCNVPAIMATRTLENQSDRILTIMMNPFMSCGARLPVYALFAAVFFPVGGQNLVFGLYLVGIAFAVITGIVLKNTLLQGEITPFVLELPPYRLPTVRSILLNTWDRLKAFIFRASKVLIPIIAILNFINSMGIDGSFGNENTDKSILSSIGRSITPIFGPMGITEENWPATVGIFTGVFAKEAVVGTLDALYSKMESPTTPSSNAQSNNGDSDGVDFWSGITAAFATIPENLAGVRDTLLDPLGIFIDQEENLESSAKEQGEPTGTFNTMLNLFDGKMGAFAYLIFILLYFPCLAATAAVYRETNVRWTGFVCIWTTGLAYMASVIFYQAATIHRHPVSSLLWITFLSSIFIGTIKLMHQLGKTEDSNPSLGSFRLKAG